MNQQQGNVGNQVVSQVRFFDSADLIPMETRQPPDSDHFCMCVEISIGPRGGLGEELFQVLICTPSWLASEIQPGEYLFARHYLLVQRYDFHLIQNAIHKQFNGVQGDTWQEVALVLARWGQWEFEDIQEAQSV